MPLLQTPLVPSRHRDLSSHEEGVMSKRVRFLRTRMCAVAEQAHDNGLASFYAACKQTG